MLSLLPQPDKAKPPGYVRLIRILLVVLVIALVIAWVWRHRMGEAEDFDRMEAQFKYGSIGSDHPLAQAPIPYWIWKVLPELFSPRTIIPKRLGPDNDLRSYAAFGFVVEEKTDRARNVAATEPPFERPVGFPRRRVFGVDIVGMNCAFCHQGTYRATASAPRQLVLGGTGNAVNVEQYFLFLFSAMTGPGFNAENVMPAVDRELARQRASLPWWQRLLYRYVIIPVIPRYLAWLEKRDFDFINPNNDRALPPFGPGRAETWGLYKRTFIDPPQHDEMAGTVDFPSIWNQKARAGMRMHWDGNTDVLVERNVVSALGLVGNRVQYLDFDRLSRVTDWIEGLLPPRYVDRFPPELLPAGSSAVVDAALALRGSAVYNEQCGGCHSAQGDRIGRVAPSEDLGTDGARIADFTPALRDALNRQGTDRWQLRNFRIEHGYVNTPLDGAWLRAPYLHNGSVPTMRDLLAPEAERPAIFCRGYDVYDWQNLGFVTPAPVDGKDGKSCPGLFLYDTSKPGNGNRGHLYGTSLDPADKRALMEFMKTL